MANVNVGDIVIAPEGCEEYLTPGKEYEVILLWGHTAFKIKDDEGDIIHCRIKDCAHLNFKHWILKENSLQPV